MKASLAQPQVGFLNSLLMLLNELLSMLENRMVSIQHLPFATDHRQMSLQDY